MADDDKPFGILMREWGIPRPVMAEPVPAGVDWFKFWADLAGKGKRGTSSLTKYECPECGLKVRIGIKSDPEIIHEPCSIKKAEKVFFVRADTLAQAMLGVSKDSGQPEGKDGK